MFAAVRVGAIVEEVRSADFAVFAYNNGKASGFGSFCCFTFMRKKVTKRSRMGPYTISCVKFRRNLSMPPNKH